MELWSDPGCLLRQGNDELLLLDVAMQQHGIQGVAPSIHGARLPTCRPPQGTSTPAARTATGSRHSHAHSFIRQ